MEKDKTGARLLKDKPRINNSTIDRKYLSSLSSNTLGKEYSRFLDSLHTSPDARPNVKYIDDPNHLYVMQRYRETHDFTHIVLNMRTNMVGEVVVKYFEGIQLGLPMCVAAAIFGGVRLKSKNRQNLLDEYLPWAIAQACNSKLLISVDWENHWETPLPILRKQLGLMETPELGSLT
ncbi:unnamed protein product [Auanema sp. JU1783]|nr:unnamed protein product [Auanema sp. JU1783]